MLAGAMLALVSNGLKIAREPFHKGTPLASQPPGLDASR
jgi:hypothetical protein